MFKKFFGGGKSSWPNFSASPPSLETTLAQTASDLAKQAKLKIASDALLLQQMQALASDEVTDVRRLKAKHLGAQFADCARPGGDPMGDIFICDDYHNSHGYPPPHRPNALALAVLLLAAVLAAGGVGAWLVSSRTVAVQQKVDNLQPQFDPIEFEVQVEFKDGKWSKTVRPVQPSN